MPKNLILVNPIAGRGNGAKLSPSIETTLKHLGLDFDLRHTEFAGHAIQLAEQAAAHGYDLVVAAGGDSTANEVLNGLMQAAQNSSHECAMGLISVGRGNDFAFGARVPAKLQAACITIASMKGTQAGHPTMRTDRVAQVTVSALKGSLPAHADGETLCVAGESLQARIVPHALQIMIPQENLNQ